MNQNKKLAKLSKKTLVCAVAISMTACLTKDVAFAEPIGTKKIEKEESIYVNANPNGKATNTTVSEWIKNVGDQKLIQDVSSLKQIENIKGEEKFSQNGTALTWNSTGKDIYYQGTSNKELPVAISIVYELDGKEIKPEELPGKSGNFTMKVQYTNTSKEGQVYTPFTMLTGMLLSTDVFSQVSIDHGRVVSDGNHLIVLGMGMPGLKESLQLESDSKLEIPEGFTLTAKVKDFSMSPTLTIATCKLLEELDLTDITDFDTLSEELTKLKDASTELVAGSKTLCEGLVTLQGKTKEFATGVTALNSGITKVFDGGKALFEGVNAYTKGVNTLVPSLNTYVNGVDSLAKGSKSYVDGTEKLSQGIGQLAKETSSLPAKTKELSDGLKKAKKGAEQLTDPNTTTLLTTTSQQVATGTKGVHDALVQMQTVLNSGTAIDLEGMKTVLTDSINQQKAVLDNLNAVKAEVDVLNGVESQVPVLLASAYDSLKSTNMGMLEESIQKLQVSIQTNEALLKKINTVDNSSMDSMKKNLEVLVENTEKLAAGASGVDKGVKSILGGAKDLNQGLGTLAKGGNQLASGAQSLSGAITQLKNGSNMLNKNNTVLKDGADTLLKAGVAIHSGTSQLATKGTELFNGAQVLFEGTMQLKNGGTTLSQGATKLSDGVDQLAEGGTTLKEGMVEFDNEGIKKLTDAFDGNLTKAVDRLKELQKAGKDYRSFAGIEPDMAGESKIVIETSEISK